MDQYTIGDRIRELRKAKNLTQDDLAMLTNSSRVQINQWETGARELSASRVMEFAAALDTSCDFLLRGVPMEKAESFNQTGLDMHSLNAFADIMTLSEHKKKQYLSVLNGILGTDFFWRNIMPHILAAFSIREKAVLGGAFESIKDYKPEEFGDKIKESIQLVTLANTAGYTDHILINSETAIALQIQEAVDAFKLLLNAIIEKSGREQSNPLAAFTAPYRANNAPNETISISEFIEYVKAMGLTIDNTSIGKDKL